MGLEGRVSPEGHQPSPWFSQPGELQALEVTQVPDLSVLPHPTPSPWGDWRGGNPPRGSCSPGHWPNITRGCPWEMLPAGAWLLLTSAMKVGQAEQEGRDEPQQPPPRMAQRIQHHRSFTWPPRGITEGFSRAVQLLLLLPRTRL